MVRPPQRERRRESAQLSKRVDGDGDDEGVEVVALSLQGYGYGNEDEEDDRPEKPRRYGVTEMRSPFYSFRPANQALQVRRRLTAASLPPLFWALRVLCSDSFGVLL